MTNVNNTLFLQHIPKCGGNGMHNIFKSLGYKLNTICNGNCGHKKIQKKII